MVGPVELVSSPAPSPICWGPPSTAFKSPPSPLPKLRLPYRSLNPHPSSREHPSPQEPFSFSQPAAGAAAEFKAAAAGASAPEAPKRALPAGERVLRGADEILSGAAGAAYRSPAQPPHRAAAGCFASDVQAGIAAVAGAALELPASVVAGEGAPEVAPEAVLEAGVGAAQPEEADFWTCNGIFELSSSNDLFELGSEDDDLLGAVGGVPAPPPLIPLRGAGSEATAVGDDVERMELHVARREATRALRQLRKPERGSRSRRLSEIIRSGEGSLREGIEGLRRSNWTLLCCLPLYRVYSIPEVPLSEAGLLEIDAI